MDIYLKLFEVLFPVFFIIGIGFVAMMQLSAYSIGAMDRSIEKNKMNFLSEMVLEDMIGDPYNATNYGSINVGCNYSSSN